MPRSVFRNRLDSDIANALNIAMPAGSQAFSGLAPSVLQGFGIGMPAGSLLASGTIPTLVTPRSIAVPIGALAFTGRAPTAVNSGSSDIIFDGAFTGGSGFPLYGWNGDPTDSSGGNFGNGYNNHWTMTQLAGQAPSGADAVRITAIGLPSAGSYAESSGWWTKTGLTSPAQGATWYVRYRFRYNGTQSWETVDGGNGVIKSSIIGDSTPSGDRIMTHMQAGGTPDILNIVAAKGIAFNSPGDYVLNIAHNTWHAAQAAWQSSSTSSAQDGRCKLWLNNDDFGSPDKDVLCGGSSDHSMPTANWGGGSQAMRFGCGTFRTILTGNNFSIDWADFQLATSFDSSWSANT